MGDLSERWLRAAKGYARRYAWVALPLVAWLVDVALLPYLFHTELHPERVTLARLKAEGRSFVGRIAYRDIFVSLDDMANSRYLRGLGSERADVITSALFSSDREHLLGGPLYAGVRDRLTRLAPAEADKYRASLREQLPIDFVGGCARFELAPEPARRADVRWRRIYTLFLSEDGDQDKSPAAIRKGLARCFMHATTDESDTVVLHAVAVNPKNPKSLRLRTVHEEALAALLERGSPKSLQLSLYERWERGYLESSVSQLETMLAARVAQEGGWSPRLAHVELRTFLPMLALCLGIATGAVEVTFLGFLTIAGAYYGFWDFSSKVIKALGTGTPEDLRFLLHLGVALTVAVMFRPLVQKIRVNMIFERKKENP